MRSIKIILATASAVALGATAAAAEITLHGASQFDETHVFNRTMQKFADLATQYYGGPVKFVMHKNQEIGLEKDYVAYMNQGASVDYAIVAPSHMSTFSKMATIMDMPFLFRDLDHWEKVLSDEGVMKLIYEDVKKRADILMVGYGGGGIRQLIVKRPIRNMAELKGLKVRVMGAPIQTRMFEAISAAPTVIAFAEVYNAMQTGVIDAAENEAAGINIMKFYEVGPDIGLTKHAITIRPLCFSGKSYRKLPEALQKAVVKAGREAGAYGRTAESAEDAQMLAAMEKKGWLKTHEFAERGKLLALADPVRKAFASEVGAGEFLAKVDGVK